MHFINANIFRNGKFSKGELWVADGVIQSKGKGETVDVQGHYLIPGLIDLQLNGAFGSDFTANPESVAAVAKQLGRFGVTSFLATLVSADPQTYQNALPQLKELKTTGAELLGIHLEGPCINPVEVKAHRAVSCDAFFSPKQCYGTLEGVKLVTLAPEVAQAHAWVPALQREGIVVSVGHSRATVSEMERAIEAGVQMATHLFNGMGSFHHRSPGIVGVVLSRPGFPYSLIADGVHLDPHVVKIAWKAQPEGLILVSDAMAAAGMPDGEYVLGGRIVSVVNGLAKIKGEEVLAGCAYGLGELLARFCAMTGATLAEAVPCVTEKPARLLGLYPKKGSLEVGADADLTLLDQQLKVVSCYAKGVKIF